MKKVLSLLVTYVLLQTQTWALSGGPVFDTPGSVTNVVGTFSGVLSPRIFGDTSIGIFSLTVPTSGLSSGAFNYFTNGSVFVGTISGVADPEKNSITAFLSATATSRQYITTTTTTTTGGVIVTTTNSVLSTVGSGFATGTLEANVKAARGSTDVAAIGARLKGDATLSIVRAPAPPGGNQEGFPANGDAFLSVTGFRQQ